MPDQTLVATAKAVTTLLAAGTFSVPITVERAYFRQTQRPDQPDGVLATVVGRGYQWDRAARRVDWSRPTVVVIVEKPLASDWAAADVDALVNLVGELVAYVDQPILAAGASVEAIALPDPIYDVDALTMESLFQSAFELTYHVDVEDDD